VISPVVAWTRDRTGLGDRLGPGSLAAWQLERAGRMVDYARTHGRFYAQLLAGVDGSRCATRAGFTGLPFTGPGDLARDPMAFLCVPQSRLARMTTLATSGSSGPPKRVGCTEADLERTVAFFARGMTDLVEPGQEVLILLPGGGEHGVGRLLQEAVGRIGVAGRLARPGWGAGDILAAARSAHCLVGLPAELFYLCRADPGLRPRTLLLSGDHMAPPVLEALARTWGCRVVTHYGLTEAGLGCAVQCRAGQGHHLRDAELLFEIIDPHSGRPLAHGEPGEIVVTTLAAEAMPLIRYRTGDLARMLPGPCPCGGPLPLLGPVEGRRDQAIRLEGGTLTLQALDDRVYAQPGVRAFSAVLRRGRGPDRLVLTVDGDRAVDPDLLRTAVPEGLAVTVRRGTVDPFASRGKRRIQVVDGP
jgi:phenylacetate-coenzyme A ligase PaaK-like adenylate-forming protein